MRTAAFVVAALAALLHVYIWWMESVAWTRPEIWKRFGVADQEAADTTRPMAYNQGFYNLFLAVGAAVGIGLWAAGHDAAGRALVLFACGSMLAAALVLLTTGKAYARAAASQGTLPALAVLLTCLA